MLLKVHNDNKGLFLVLMKPLPEIPTIQQMQYACLSGGEFASPIPAPECPNQSLVSLR